jgi:hypothetical protein
MVTPKPITQRSKVLTLYNPQRKTKPRAKKRNPPGELIALGYLNPKRSTMKKERKRKKKHNALPNPEHRARRRTRNPDAAGLVRKPLDMLKAGALAAGGLLATRQLPQILLGARNQGVVGYVANLATAALAGSLAGAALGAEAGAAVAIGGSLYAFNRILSEQTALGKQLSLSGVGDAQAAGHLGALVPGYWTHPVVKDRQGNPWIPNQIIEAAAQAVLQRLPQPQPAAATMGRFSSRY